MKRNIKLLITGSLLSICILSLTSCLKNNKYYIDFASVGTTVEMAMAPAKAVPPPDAMYYSTDLGASIYVDTLQYSASSQTVPIYVNVASPKVPSSPTSATLELDTAALKAINAEYGGVSEGYTSLNGPGAFTFIPAGDGVAYEILPDSCYTVSSWDVTVPADQRLSPLNVTVLPNKIDTSTIWIKDASVAADNNGKPVPYEILKHHYLIPVTIKAASQTVSNWKTVFVNVQVMKK